MTSQPKYNRTMPASAGKKNMMQWQLTILFSYYCWIHSRGAFYLEKAIGFVYI